jgi:large subunit ribosomal protein L10
VYKNTLARIAVREAGPEGLEDLFEGPTAFTFATGDPVEAAKKLAEFAKKVPTLVLKGGILDGKLLSAEQVNALAALDSREVMLSKAAGIFIATIQQAANVFAAGFNQLGAVLVQLRDKLPAEGTPDAPAEPTQPVDEAPEQPGAVAEAPTAEAPAPASTEEAPAEPGSSEETQS